MNQSITEADKLIDRRRKIQNIGQLRYEKMMVKRVGERRMHGENQMDQQCTKETKK